MSQHSVFIEVMFYTTLMCRELSAPGKAAHRSGSVDTHLPDGRKPIIEYA